MQYSLFTHGNALRVETPETLVSHSYFGWGAQMVFAPPAGADLHGLPVQDEEGPGSWLHLPLPSTLNTFGKRSPRLDSVTLLFEASHCRIKHVHVYDGARIIQQFDNEKLLKGDFLTVRDSDDINPEAPPAVSQSFPNTLKLRKPHRVFSAIGISFYACAFAEDFNVRGHVYNPRFDGPLPPAILTVAAGGGQFLVEDSSSVTVHVGDIRVLVGP